MSLEKIAHALDLIADEIEREEIQRSAPEVPPDPITEALRSKLGAYASPEVLAHLSGDDEVRTLFGGLLGTPESPRALGGPAEKSASTPNRMSRAEAQRQAEEESLRLLDQYTSR